MTTYSLYDGASGRPGTGSSGTQPPATAASYTGSYIAGQVFEVTSGGLWLQGYRWWVPGTNGNTAAQKFALRNIYVAGSAALVPGGTVTSGTLTAGAWNTVMLPVPILLTPNIPYLACTGLTSTSPAGFPDTVNQFGATQPYASGVTNGPLHHYGNSDGAGAANWALDPFSTAGSDPTVTTPVTNNQNDILWLDVIVSDQPPPNATYRAWPSMATPWPTMSTTTDQTGYTLGFQFSLSQACTLSKIWHYSPSGSTVLPTRCLIWNVAGQTAVSGTDNQTPAWSGAAGSGWISCDYSGSGVTLQASTQYKVSTFHSAGVNWFGATASVFGAGQLQANGWTTGPLTIPGNAAASPGQASWNTVTFAYPNTSTNPESDWIDVEVIPPSGGLLMATFP
jgi:hypothetical protein